ncbi:lysosomal protective protein precursor, putative [Perkinsus marinus ATCC 50983]|uniref:Lysosomal protective protein, putative n=1 Tax=Perkinsus marinus (strain ATCC 50983 / TXsc) TaxID=423536 RepID=C5L4J6_PERM5|nr:lysosomal protective protein precursor, putative [Perkinsus marinus ATCC 50983]EER08327.1 lysosomal protective protein precursor, putative [Perkinsus marinus ATCC 50983]|eukprot:XP_002776511.1 lysosomal protective protein precursor, putative [Perkinsus marinus ATCC 50983]
MLKIYPLATPKNYYCHIGKLKATADLRYFDIPPEEVVPALGEASRMIGVKLTYGRFRGKSLASLGALKRTEPLCDSTVVQYHGYLSGRDNNKLFYWFFESRDASRESPTLIYFQGGPGASSLFSAVSGNGGPCVVNDDGESTSMNEFSWNTKANVMYLEQPAGVGFSKGTPPTNSVKAADSTYLALIEFFRSRPKYNTRVFLAGQSFAGMIIRAQA